MNKKLLWSGFLAAGLLHAGLGSLALRSLAPTYDEPVHVTAGFSYWKTGSYQFNGYYHPPVAEMTASVPLLFSSAFLPVQDPIWIAQRWTPGAQYRFADRFLYHNRLDPIDLLGRARSMQLFISCLMVAAIGFIAFQIGGLSAGLFAAFASALSTTLLAHGTLVSNDLLFSAAYFCFFSFLPLRKNRWGSLALGLLLGFCLGSKYSAVALFGSLAALAGWNWIRKRDLKSEFFPALWMSGSAVLFLLAVYRFSEFETYFTGLRHFLNQASSGRSNFFFGRHGLTGFWGYFPMAFLMKTEIPVLLALFLSAGFALTKKLRLPARLILPPLAFFGVVMMSKVQIGHRYLLPIYPFLFVIASAGMILLPSVVRKVFMPIFLIWMAVSTWLIRPHYLTYFNEASGGPSLGYRYFTDSNMDWGQGLSFLSHNIVGEDTARGIYLCYFGVADPHAYGIKYWDVLSDSLAGHQDDSNDLTLNPTLFAISVTNLQSTYYADKTLFAWLAAYKPVSLIANSILLYDFSNQPEALEKLKAFHLMTHGK